MTPPSRSAEVSNAELMNAILEMKQDIGRQGEQLDTVIKLQRHTNGDVSDLKLWRVKMEAADDALEKYKKEQPVIQHADAVTVKQAGFFDNPKAAGLITTLIALMLALAGYLTYLAGGH